MKVNTRFRRGLLGLSLLLLGAVSAPAMASPPWEGKRYALVVGIDDYQNPAVTDLKCATSDAKLFKDTLVTKGKFPEENIFLLTSGATGESSEPSLTNIVFRLEWLREVVGPGDTLVFYFAGHGVAMDSETYLLTEEADQRTKNTLVVSSLPGKVLNNLLKETGAQNTLVLLDACRNDPTAGRGDVNNTLNETLARGLVFKPSPPAAGLQRNSATLFACSEGERSWEWSEKNHGFFTYFLAEGLNSGAFDSSGNATLQNLVGYLGKKVNEAALRETNHKQTPMVEYSGPGAEGWVLVHGDPVGVPAPTMAQIEYAELVAQNERAQAKIRQLEAEKSLRESQQEVAVAQASVNEYGGKAKSGDEVARKQLDLAEKALTEAQAGVEADQNHLALAAAKGNELETRFKAIGSAKIAYFGAANSPEVAQAKAELAEYEKRLTSLEGEKKQAVERAVKAEAKLADVQAELDALEAELAKNDSLRWKGRPSRHRRRSDIWWVDAPNGEEATELP